MGEPRERKRGGSDRTAWEDAEDWGCDMDQLSRSLALTVEERLLRHDRALAAARALRTAIEAGRDES